MAARRIYMMYINKANTLAINLLSCRDTWSGSVLRGGSEHCTPKSQASFDILRDILRKKSRVISGTWRVFWGVMFYQHLDLIILPAKTWWGHFWGGLAAPEGLFPKCKPGNGGNIFNCLKRELRKWLSEARKLFMWEGEWSDQPRVENSQGNQAEEEQTEHRPCRWVREPTQGSCCLSGKMINFNIFESHHAVCGKTSLEIRVVWTACKTV